MKEIEQGNNEVIIHQDVARLRGRLTSTQSRSMLAILKRANEQVLENSDIKVFSIPTEIFLEDIQDKDNTSLELKLKRISKHLEELMVKIFEWGTKKSISKTVFMQQVEITENEVKFKFSDYIREHIKPVVNVMIVDDFELIQSFRSEYARQLYKHIMMWKNKEHLYLSLEDFKDFLGVPITTSYKRMDVLKRKILNVALKEINEKRAEINLKYENRTKKRSKKIIGFDFYWTWAKQEKEQPKLFENQPTIDEQISALKGRNIYIQNQLFFFQDIRQKDGKYEIIATDKENRTVSISTIHIEAEATIETIKNMMK